MSLLRSLILAVIITLPYMHLCQSYSSACSTAIVRPGDTCSRIYSNYFRGVASSYTKCNEGSACTSSPVPKSTFCITPCVSPLSSPSSSSCKAVKVHPADGTILMNFKSNITSDPSNVLRSWNTTKTCNLWSGVCCDSRGRVIKLALRSKYLSGVLIASLGDLPSLIYLDLFGNNLIGTIASKLWSHKVIQHIDFGSNRLSGPLVSEYKAPLTFVNLENNYFSPSSAIISRGRKCTSKPKFYTAGNCLAVKVFNVTCYGPQKSASVCASFCRADLLVGACGGHGYCRPGPIPTLNSCRCDPNYRITSRVNCTFSVAPTFGVADFEAPSTTKLSPYFRYASMLLDTPKRNPLKSQTTSMNGALNWANILMNWPVINQGVCGSCWAVATVSTVEAAIAITGGMYTPPKLSVYQVLDCQGLGSCGGGWPVNAFEYIATNGITEHASYSGFYSASCPVAPFPYHISHYEKVDFYGWKGLFLAVQQQPIVVFVDASSAAFMNYAGGVFNNDNCYSQGINHAVVLVGYNFDHPTPYWIIRNSWGSVWGEDGYMKLQIQAGAGICGINLLPGYYPVIQNDEDPCNMQSLVSAVNPCGLYECTPASGSSSFSCDCSGQFIAVSFQGSRVCIPKNPCEFFTKNPCSIGKCISGDDGNYACACPVGYSTSYSADGANTCIPDIYFNYTVPASTTVDCDMISQIFHIPKQLLMDLNPNVTCPYAGGTVLNIKSLSFDGSCAVSYVINQDDDCPGLEQKFGNIPLAGEGTPNPLLDCTNLIPGQTICVVLGQPLDQGCKTTITPNGSDSCDSFIQSPFSENATAFFMHNPGIYCDKLIQDGIAIQDICIEVQDITTNLCPQGLATGTVQSGHNCQYLYYHYFAGTASKFKDINNYLCSTKRPQVRQKFCYNPKDKR